MSAGTSEFFCLICLLVCSCTAQEKITAKHGQDVILPCKASNINDISDIRAVEWIRPGLDPEYVLLYRDGRFDTDNQHPSYENRVDLQNKEMKDGDFYLILKNVTMEDTGKYVCRVSQKGKTEPFSIIYLKVYLSAQEKITAEPGQDVILPCKAPDNKITAAEWRRPGLDPDYVLLYRNRSFDPDNRHESYQNRVVLQDKEMKDGDFSLILKNVTMEDRGTYECLVDQSGKNDLISIINLEVHPPDHSWIIVGVVVGVLVCLLLAAAVFLYRQYRKMKTLENEKPEEVELLERNHSETKNQLQFMNSHLEELMEIRRNLQNSIQKMIQELICCTNSDPTGSFKENLQEKLEKLQEENQKWMKTVENLKTELQNMNQKLNEMIGDSTEENPQEEDKKLNDRTTDERQ